MDGVGIGIVVGRETGSKLGRGEGGSVGYGVAAVGEKEADGPLVGVEMGTSAGSFVGVERGTAVGAEIGASVGAGMGILVGVE